MTSTLRLYAPMMVVGLIAAVWAAGAKSAATIAAGLLVLAAAIAVHVFEERRRKSDGRHSRHF